MTARLIHGEALAVLRDLPDASVDAVITDPPYSSGGTFRGDRAADPTSKYVPTKEVVNFHATFTGDNRDQRSYGYWCALWMSECLRITKPGGVLLCFTDWRQLPMTTDAIQAGGWLWRGVVVWDKTPGIVRPRAVSVNSQSLCPGLATGLCRWTGPRRAITACSPTHPSVVSSTSLASRMV